MRGLVRDESNAVVPGVTITVSNADAGVVRTVATDPDGSFSIPALAVGTYTVRAERSQFSVELLNDVVLTVGSAVDLSITLRVSPVTEQTTVVAAGEHRPSIPGRPPSPAWCRSRKSTTSRSGAGTSSRLPSLRRA